MNILLSICIPTYNRADTIGQTLESILPQIEEGVEVVICDNGSTDETEAVVAQYRSLIPQMHYFRFEQNQGVDRCFIQSVAIAHGEFCWLMGSDDKIEEGSIRKILAVLRAHPDLTGISVSTRVYDSMLQSRLLSGRQPPFPQDCLLETFEQFFPSLYIYAGFLSGQVVKRIYWQEVVETKPVEKFFNCYVLVYIITQMVCQRPRWFYIHQPCVGYRADNDSFMDRGAYRRLSIDIVGFSAILSQWFTADHPIYKKTMGQIAQIDVVWRLLRARLGRVEKGFWRNAFQLCWAHYATYAVFWRRLLPFFIVPGPVWHVVRWLYRCTLKKKKLAQLESSL